MSWNTPFALRRLVKKSFVAMAIAMVTTAAAFGHGGGGGGSGGGGHAGGGGGGGHASGGSRASAGSGAGHFRGGPQSGGRRSMSQPYSRAMVGPSSAGHRATVHGNRSGKIHPSVRGDNFSGGAGAGRNAGGMRGNAPQVNSAKASHASRGNRAPRHKLNPQTSDRLRHWNGRKDSLTDARHKHDTNCHHHHGHGWWRNHCPIIIWSDWGWWGWDSGWWYPAWGYDPYYSSYECDGPVYGYDELPPDEVIANVQSALQERGYYSFAVDGKFGPVTDAALARYQRDARLPVTHAIDPETLQSLGLIER